jgi:hypothetical protein
MIGPAFFISILKTQQCNPVPLFRPAFSPNGSIIFYNRVAIDCFVLVNACPAILSGEVLT